MGIAADAAQELAVNGHSSEPRAARQLRWSQVRRQQNETQFSKTSMGVMDSGTAESVTDIRGSHRERKSERTGITNETRASYHKFLKEHLAGLTRLFATHQGQELLREVSPEDFELLNTLGVKDERGTILTDLNDNNVKKLEENIRHHLDTSRGQVQTTLVMNRMNEWSEAAMGITSETNPRPAPDNGVTTPRGQPLEMGEGPLGDAARRLQEFLAERTASFEGRPGNIRILGIIPPPELLRLFTVPWRLGMRNSSINDINRLETGWALTEASILISLATTIATGGITAPILAGSILLPWLAEGGALSIGKGLAQDHSPMLRTAGFIDSRRAAFIKAMTGFDMLAPSASTKTPENLRLEVDARVKSRQNWLKEIGADQSRAESTAWGYLLNPSGRADPEKVALTWMRDMIDDFNAQGGAVDFLGRTRYIRNAQGSIVENALFMTGGATVDYAVTLEKFHQAERNAEMRNLQRDIQQEMKRELTRNDKFDERLTSLNEEQLRQGMEAEIKTRDPFENDRSAVDTIRGPVNTYQEAVRNLEGLLANARQELNITFETPFTDVEEAIEALESILEQSGTSISFRRGGAIASILDKEKPFADERDTDIHDAAARLASGSITEERFNILRQFYLDEYQRKVKAEPFAKERQRIEAELARFKVLKEGEMRDGERAGGIDEARNNLRIAHGDSINTLNVFTTDFAEIRRLGVTEAQLRTRDINQILEAINARPRGWPQQRNQERDIRNMVLNAMIEARGRRVDQTTADRGRLETNFNSLTSAATWNMNIDELSTMALEDIRRELERRRLSLTPPPATIPPDNEIRDAIDFARLRFSSRGEAAGQVNTQLGGMLDGQANEIARIDVRDRRARLLVGRELTMDFDSLLETPSRILQNAAQFTDNTRITAADTEFTPAERARGAERGYYEMLDLLFDYRKRDFSKAAQGIYEQGENRETYFNKISSVVTPERLMAIMAESMWPGTPALPDFGTFLAYLRGEMASRNIGDVELTRAMIEVIRRFHDEGNAVV